jgi:hypothetical protein
MLRLTCLVAGYGVMASSVSAEAAPSPPHLAQAWVAMSTGDGEPGATGKESYLYEDEGECHHHASDTCVKAHIFDYGANTCVKYEIDRGFDSKYTGTYYVKCDAVNCCAGDPTPDLKKWDIGEAGKSLDKVKYLGKKDTTELNGNPVKDADVWQEHVKLPFTPLLVDYTYYITNNGSDVITHRIDWGVSDNSSNGVILYGDFQVQHNLTDFRTVFEPPADCLVPNVDQCQQSKVDEWEQKYFARN